METPLTQKDCKGYYAVFDQFSFNPPFSISRLGYCSCRYYFDEFSDLWFEHLDIDRPPTLFRAAPKRMSEFLAGRYCARLALINFTGGDNFSRNLQIPIKDDRGPQWPPGIVGSITHTSNTAAVIIARNSAYRGLGIDCETVLLPTEANIVQDYILNEKDLSCPEIKILDAGFFVTLTFSAKESLYKALSPSTHETLDFQDLCIMNIGSTTLTLKLLKTVSPIWVSGSIFEVVYAKQNDIIFTMVCLEV